MLYYRVNRQHYTGKGHELVEGELITHKEMEKYYPEVFPLHYIKRGIITEVSISSRETYWIFGCRFTVNTLNLKEIKHYI